MSIEEAYREVCKEAEEAEHCWVCLYCKAPFYGGPEEGGWWGCDVLLMESQRFACRAQAEAVKAKVEKVAEQLKEDAKVAHDRMCLAQLGDKWDGEEAQFRYGEVDGPSDYFVVIEDVPGASESIGSRHYE